MTSNAIHGYKKSHGGVASTDIANWNVQQKTLCIYSTPKKTFKQQLAALIRRWAK